MSNEEKYCGTCSMCLENCSNEYYVNKVVFSSTIRYPKEESCESLECNFSSSKICHTCFDYVSKNIHFYYIICRKCYENNSDHFLKGEDNDKLFENVKFENNKFENVRFEK